MLPGLTFPVGIIGSAAKVFDFIGPPTGFDRSATSVSKAESSPFSNLIIFLRQNLQIVCDRSNRYFDQYTYDVQKHWKHFVETTRYCIFSAYNSNGTRTVNVAVRPLGFGSGLRNISNSQVWPTSVYFLSIGDVEVKGPETVSGIFFFSRFDHPI